MTEEQHLTTQDQHYQEILLIKIRIIEMLEQRDFSGIREWISSFPPPYQAEIIQMLQSREQGIIFRLLPQKKAAEVFEYLDISSQEDLLKALGQNEVAAILNDMSPDDRTHLLEELPGELTKRLLSLLSPEEKKIAQTLLGYPENSIGRLMTSDYIAVRSEWAIKEALDYIRTHGQDSETLNVIYVTDGNGKLIDDIRVREFLLAPLENKVESLMDYQFIAMTSLDDQEEAVHVFRKFDRVALPVTDSMGILIGIVTIDDIIDVAEEEATEDIQQIAGMEALEEPYMTTSFLRMVKKRGVWLILLFIGEMLTATAMAYYEHEIASAVVLALFIPLIISSGGNSGSQAAALVVRAIALGELSFRDGIKVLKRECLTGLLLGGILGSIGFIRVAFFASVFHTYGDHWFLIASTVFFSLVSVVMLGTLSGAMLPLILKRVGLDPATSSVPFIATLVDVTGIILYFTIASFLLKGVLL